MQKFIGQFFKGKLYGGVNLRDPCGHQERHTHGLGLGVVNLDSYTNTHSHNSHNSRFT